MGFHPPISYRGLVIFYGGGGDGFGAEGGLVVEEFEEVVDGALGGALVVEDDLAGALGHLVGGFGV